MLQIDSDYHILAQEEIEAFRDRPAPAILVPMHCRHPDLEVDPDGPEDLGEIDGLLDEQNSVRRLSTHVAYRSSRASRLVAGAGLRTLSEGESGPLNTGDLTDFERQLSPRTATRGL